MENTKIKITMDSDFYKLFYIYNNARERQTDNDNLLFKDKFGFMGSIEYRNNYFSEGDYVVALSSVGIVEGEYRLSIITDKYIKIMKLPCFKESGYSYTIEGNTKHSKDERYVINYEI